MPRLLHREDFTTGQRRSDIILDNIENRSSSEVRRALTPNGTLVLNGGTGASRLRTLTRLVRPPLILSPLTSHSVRRSLSNPKRADLEWLAERVAEGSVRPCVGAICRLAETGDALRLIEGSQSRGKVVIAMASSVP